MCGRFNVTSDPLQSIFMELVGQSYPGTDNHNTAPTTPVWIIRNCSKESNSDLKAIEARWWLTPSWSKEISTKFSMFNARSENLDKSKAFKVPYRRQRCVVPITGYYEWLTKDDRKQPYYVSPHNNQGLLLAGIWDEWIDSNTGKVLPSFAIVTCAANERIRFLHHRQPVMLSKNGSKSWLDNQFDRDDLNKLLRPTIPYTLQMTPISSYIGNPNNKGVKCIAPTGASIVIRGSS